MTMNTGSAWTTSNHKLTARSFEATPSGNDRIRRSADDRHRNLFRYTTKALRFLSTVQGEFPARKCQPAAHCSEATAHSQSPRTTLPGHLPDAIDLGALDGLCHWKLHA